MKCKYCKAEDLPAHSRFCPWCGKKQDSDKTEVKVPPPRQLPSGTWFGRVTVSGERVPVSAPTEAEYYTKARAAKLELIERKNTLPKITLGAAIDNYIRDNTPVLSPSTVKGYKSYRKHRLQAYMGTGIASIPWQKMVSAEAEDIAPKTLQNVWRLVTASLRYAKAPVPTVNLSQVSRSQRPWLDYSQIQVFLKAVEGQTFEVAALLALNGLRRSELLHLTSADIDLKKNLIHVNGASVYNDAGLLVDKDTNKTRRSQRITHIVIPRLATLLEGMEGKLVTTKPNTTYAQVNRLCRRIGLPEVGCHGLRHSFASLAYHLKWSEATTMREGGWSNSKTVHDIYTHLAAQDADADVQRMIDFYTSSSAAENK